MLRVLNLRRPRGLALDAAPRPHDELASLVTAQAAGDKAALRTLLLALGSPMIQVIRRVLGARHPDVEDTLQEATLALIRALPTFRGDCTVRQFACRIATFTAISTRRRQRPGAQSSLDDLDQVEAIDDLQRDLNGDAASPIDWAVAARRRLLVRLLLDELPLAQAEALVLHAIAGLTVEELAGATGAPFETVRSRLRLAKAALRTRIAADPQAAELLEDAP